MRKYLARLLSFYRRPINPAHELASMVHDLHRVHRDEEIKQLLAIDKFQLPERWHALGRYFPVHYNKSGKIRNMWLLRWAFRQPIRRALAAMSQARQRAELMVGILGDEQEFIKMLRARRQIQEELISCLGLTEAPVRYMTNYWVRKIGHLAQIEFYFKAMKLGFIPPYRLIIMCKNKKEIANNCLLDYWKEHIRVIVSRRAYRRQALEAKILEVDIHLFEGTLTQPCLYHKQAAALAWHQWEFEKRPPLFSMKASHLERGRAALRQMGVPENAWFVALHIRESGFSDETGTSPRDASIENYLPAIQEINARGGWVIRVGDKGMKQVPQKTGFLDYPHTPWKSDWMDVFLLAACRFFIGVASGPAGVPPLFGVPCVYTNWMPMADYPYHGKALLIHKTHRDSVSGQKAPYSRFVSMCTDYNLALKRTNLILEENTAEELREVVIEMLDHLDGTLPGDQENDQRQAQFRELAGIKSPYGRPSLGRKFLESNAALL